MDLPPPPAAKPAPSRSPEHLSPAPSTLLHCCGSPHPEHPLPGHPLSLPLSSALHCGETRLPLVTLDALWIFFSHGLELRDTSPDTQAQLAPPPIASALPPSSLRTYPLGLTPASLSCPSPNIGHGQPPQAHGILLKQALMQPILSDACHLSTSSQHVQPGHGLQYGIPGPSLGHLLLYLVNTRHLIHQRCAWTLPGSPGDSPHQYEDLCGKTTYPVLDCNPHLDSPIRSSQTPHQAGYHHLCTDRKQSPGTALPHHLPAQGPDLTLQRQHSAQHHSAPPTSPHQCADTPSLQLGPGPRQEKRPLRLKERRGVVSKERVEVLEASSSSRSCCGTTISDKLQGFQSGKNHSCGWPCHLVVVCSTAGLGQQGQSCEETSPQDSRTDSAAAAASPSLSPAPH